MQKNFAGLWPRLKAFAFDYVVIAVYLMLVVVLGALLHALVPALATTLFQNQFSSELFGFITVTLPVSLYFAISEASPQQATWGKRRVKLKVVRIRDGNRLSIEHSVIRTALKFIPWEMSHASIWYVTFHPKSSSPLFPVGITIVFLIVGLNVLALLLSRTHQTLYDMIAGTVIEKTG